jgi:hypothetical protein
MGEWYQVVRQQHVRNIHACHVTDATLTGVVGSERGAMLCGTRFGITPCSDA